jgi:RHS repeat-associated protein
VFSNSKPSLKNRLSAAGFAFAAAASASLAQSPTSPDAQYSCIVLASDGATNPAAAYFNREGLTIVITRYAWNLELAGPAGDQHVIIQAGHDADIASGPPNFIQTHLKVEGAVTGSNTEIHSGAFVFSTASTNTTYHVQETDWSDGRVQQAPLNTWDEHATFSVTPSGQNLDWSDLGANQSFRLATGSGEPEADSIGSVSYTPTTRIVNLGLDGAHIYTVIESNGHQSEMLTATIETFGLIDPNGDNAQDCNCPGSAGTLGKCEIECGCVDGISSDDCTAQGGSWTASTTCAGGGSTTFCDNDTPVDPTLRDDIIYHDGDIDPLDMLCAGGDEPGGGWPTYYYNGMAAVAPAPIQQTTGQKIETATDLIVDLSGTDFRLTRRYTSVGESSNGLLGSAWAMGLFSFLGVDSSGSSPVLTLKAPQGFAQFEETNPTVSGIWTTGGPTDQTFTMEVADFDDGSAGYPVWRLTEPGGWQTDFHRAAEMGETVASTLPDSSLHGFPYQRIDVMGNRWSFYYATVGGTLTNGGEVRLSSIVCERHASDGEFDVEARISFSWHEASAEGAFGRLRAVRVARPDTSQTSGWYTTHKVAYQYFDDLLLEGRAPTDIDHLGTSGDLIQVTVSERLDDDGSTEVFRDRITQYRYHDGSRFGGSAEAVDTDSDGDGIPGEQGEEHQIKMVINPFEIEYFAQHHRDNMEAFDLAEAAQLLHNLDGNETAFTVDTLDDDGDPVSTAVPVVRLASKVIARYDTSDRVLVQYLQASCGCGGHLSGTLGVRREYAYGSHTDGAGLEYMRFTLTESSDSDADGVFEDYRIYRTHHRTQTAGGVPRLYIESIEDADTAATTWAKAYDYTSKGELKAVINTSAIDEYNPVGGTGNMGLCDPFTGAGHVMGYEYDTDSRLKAVYFRKGYDDTVAFTNPSWEKLESFTRANSVRDELVTEHVRYRVAGSTNASDQEVTKYTYYFWSPQSTSELAGQFSGHILAYKETAVERELTAENGPGPGTYVTKEIFDVNGRPVLRLAADGSMTEYFYSGDSEHLTKIVRNQATATWTTPGLDFSVVHGDGSTPTITPFTGRTDGGTLTTEYTRDQLGRVIESIAPGGITTYTYRTMSNPPSRDDNTDLLYYSEINLPHPISESGSNYDGFAGVASQTWLDASDLTAEVRDFEMPSSVAKADYRTEALDHIGSSTVASRSTTNIDWSSKSIEQRVWHDASDDNAFYLSQAQFDEFGRTLWSKDAVGNFTEYAYDLLDRVLSVSQGTDRSSGGNNLVVVTKNYYDGSTSSTTYAGDSNLTQVVRPVDGNSANDRITSMYYDVRNRLVFVENPLAPHSYTKYDNLNRPTEQHQLSELTGSNISSLLQTDRSKRTRTTRTAYSQRGLVYETGIKIDPGSISDTDVLLNSTWFDEVGRAVKSQPHSGPGTKTAFDGLGRPVHRFVGDMTGDGSTYTNVYNTTSHQPVVTGDIILQETVTDYIETSTKRGFGGPELVTNYERAHDASSTGSLSNFDGTGVDATAVATFSLMIYDEASRPVKSGFYGTNDSSGYFAGGTAPTPPSNAFSLSAAVAAMPGTALISETVYDERGRAHVSIAPDPEDTRTRTIFDDLNRTIGTVENDQTGSVVTLSWDAVNSRWSVTNSGGTTTDENRVTSFVYDGANNLIKRVAHVSDTAFQETEYDYSHDGTLVDSNSLLSSVHYPNEGTGVASTAAEYSVSYEYNRQGDMTEMTDQNETVHGYDHDTLGRVTLDKVTTFTNTDLDDTVQAIETLYSSTTGLVEYVTSYDGTDPTTDTVLNQIKYEYDSLLQLSKYRQNPTGEVGTGQSDDVEYVYDRAATGSGNYSRLDTIKYPFVNTGGKQRTEVSQHYGSSTFPTDLDHRISRSGGLDWTFQMKSVATDEIRYEHLGLNNTVIVDYPDGKITLDRQVDPNYTPSGGSGPRVAGENVGMDQYGRLGRQVWYKGSAWDPDTLPARIDVAYEYDSNSDITRRYDSRVGASMADRGDEYTYDGLHRLDLADRGAPGAGTTWDSASITEDWVLDTFGNWTAYSNSIGTSYTEDRTHNQANEITSIELNSTTPTLEVTYDAAGNLRTRETVADSMRWVYTWDAWNRLVKVEIQEYKAGAWLTPVDRVESGYYGMNQRAWSRIDKGAAGYTTGGPDEVLNREEHFYYDASWRLLERRTDTSWSSGTGFVHEQTTQWVWGNRYIDELVAYAVDTVASTSEFDTVTYAMTDRNFSVIGLVGSERIRYDAYGYAQASPFGDVNGDGTVDSSDQSIINAAFGESVGDAGYQVEADLNFNGTVDLADLNLYSSASGDSIDRGGLSGEGNIIGYAGYVFEPATGMYLVRRRWLSPQTGRWISRDPAGYVDGSSVYEYGKSNSLLYVDPSGLGVICKGPLRGIIPEPIEIIPAGPLELDPNIPVPGSPHFPGVYIPAIPTPMIRIPFMHIPNLNPWHEHIFYDDCDHNQPRDEGFFPNGIRPEREGITRDHYQDCEYFANDAALRQASRICQAREPFCKGKDGYSVVPIPPLGMGNCQSFTDCVRGEYGRLTRSSKRCIKWKTVVSHAYGERRVCIKWTVDPPQYDPNPGKTECKECSSE